MNPRGVVQRQRNGLISVQDKPGAKETLLMTRIEVGIVPPTGDGLEHGYAAVVGEIYDPDERQKQRTKILLDEARCLMPEDIPVPGATSLGREDTKHPHWGLVYANGYDRAGNAEVIRRGDVPTADDLRQAVVALKDLYHPDMGKVEKPLMAWMPPGNAELPFVQWMRATEGLMYYPTEYGRTTFKEWWPFFRSSAHKMGISNEPPFGENVDFGLGLIQSLVARGELIVNRQNCPIWLDWNLNNPRRAVGLVCAVMQHQEAGVQVRRLELFDGYGSDRPPDDRKERKEMKKARKRLRGLMRMVGARNA